jgi:hypothetical protein
LIEENFSCQAFSYMFGVEIVVIPDQLDVIEGLQIGLSEMLNEIFFGANAMKQNVKSKAEEKKKKKVEGIY